MIVTIDGPAGSGKSTAARGLARALGVAFLDTGAMYRAVTLAAMRAGVELSDEQAITSAAAGLDLHMDGAGESPRVLLAGQDVTAAIRTAEVTEKSYYAARSPGVRAVMARMQRRIGLDLAARTGGVVTEGRDQGSVVFPEADVKFYLDAAPEVRARRRQADLAAAGEQVNYEHVLRAVVQRDQRDAGRAVAPLVRPAGAVALDTSDLGIEQMVARMVEVVRGQGGRQP